MLCTYALYVLEGLDKIRHIKQVIHISLFYDVFQLVEFSNNVGFLQTRFKVLSPHYSDSHDFKIKNPVLGLHLKTTKYFQNLSLLASLITRFQK